MPEAISQKPLTSVAWQCHHGLQGTREPSEQNFIKIKKCDGVTPWSIYRGMPRLSNAARHGAWHSAAHGAGEPPSWPGSEPSGDTEHGAGGTAISRDVLTGDCWRQGHGAGERAARRWPWAVSQCRPANQLMKAGQTLYRPSRARLRAAAETTEPQC